MRVRLAWALSTLAACAFDPGSLSPAGPDGGMVMVDANPCGWGFQPAFVDPCTSSVVALAGADLAITGTATYDTDSGALTDNQGETLPPSVVLPQAGGQEVRVLVGRRVTFTGNLRVVGSRPLVVVANEDLEISGAIDASARVADDGVSTGGPGADGVAACQAGSGGNASDDASGGGGGGGGGFGTAAAAGAMGVGAGGGTAGTAGTANGTGGEVLRGGCPGGVGGDAFDVLADGEGGLGGSGGGAIAFYARRRIIVVGQVRASGAGGQGGREGSAAGASGGGGGGSGGMLLFEADTVDITAVAGISANGGSGGEGASLTGAGDHGKVGSTGENEVAAPPDGRLSGGDGGPGSARNTLPGAGEAGTDGGGSGGGGGSLGVIRIRGVTRQTVSAIATISPDTP